MTAGFAFLCLSYTLQFYCSRAGDARSFQCTQVVGSVAPVARRSTGYLNKLATLRRSRFHHLPTSCITKPRESQTNHCHRRWFGGTPRSCNGLDRKGLPARRDNATVVLWSDADVAFGIFDRSKTGIVLFRIPRNTHELRLGNLLRLRCAVSGERTIRLGLPPHLH